MGSLFDRLTDARRGLSEAPPRLDACDEVGGVQSRLYGEPGLVDVRPAWPALREAADALWAVCGQARLLQEPFVPTPATRAGRQRWQLGLNRELQVACARLKVAATALARPTPC